MRRASERSYKERVGSVVAVVRAVVVACFSVAAFVTAVMKTVLISAYFVWDEHELLRFQHLLHFIFLFFFFA